MARITGGASLCRTVAGLESRADDLRSPEMVTLDVIVADDAADRFRCELCRRLDLGTMKEDTTGMTYDREPAVFSALVDVSNDSGIHGVASEAGGSVNAFSIADFGGSTTGANSTGARERAAFMSAACCSPFAVQSFFS